MDSVTIETHGVKNDTAMQSTADPVRSTGLQRFRQFEDLFFRYVLLVSASCAVVVIFLILLFILRDGHSIFMHEGADRFLFGTFWNPTGDMPSFGILPLIVGTLLVTILAMCISVPLSLGTAIFVACLSPPKLRRIIKPAIELLAGIPSVVYGFFGLILLTEWIRILFDRPSGSSWLAGSILLAIMALPTIASVAEDAIRSVPGEFIEASLAMGATRWQTIGRVIIPSALSGITAAIILGFGRAIGETMAVLMVTGNAAIIPDPIWNIFSPIRTLTGTLGIEMGEVAFGSPHYHALFGIASVLLIITLCTNLAAVLIFKKFGHKNGVRGCSSLWSVPGSIVKRISSVALIRLSSLLRRACFAICIAILLAAVLFCGARPYILVPILGATIFLTLKGRISIPHLNPRMAERIAFLVITASALLVLAVLGIVVGEIVTKGAGAITWEFLTQSPRDLGRSGGILPAIVGTAYLVGGALLIALPIGIGTALYLVEYTGEGRITKIVRSSVDLLAGTPSIVFGLFGFAFLVLFMRFGISMIAGQITLGLMILPTIIRTTEEALKAVPFSLREGSCALGATRWETVWRVVLPSAFPGILTGSILSIGRAAGETAPIMFTAVVFSSRFLPTSVFDPVMALPYHLFILTTTVPGSAKNGYGTAFVLLLLVISLYMIAILIRERCRRQYI